MENLEQFILTKKPILIEGPTGTGKSYLAKKIHEQRSTKRVEKFRQINMSAISQNLFESELFGHERGAFSGALSNKVGFCEEIASGTLFLDEIGELSLENQAKLLTLIDEKLYYSVGSTVPKKFNGKLIFATNRNLEKLVLSNEFRQDLYFRIRFFQITLKPLSEELELEKIIWETINNLKIKRGNTNVIIETSVIDSMLGYSWPGNFRELKNTIEYFFELRKVRITKSDLPLWLKKNNKKMPLRKSKYKVELEKFEKDYIINQLRINSGKINKTSIVTGINKVTLISKLKKYGIDRKDYILESKDLSGF